MWPRNRIGIALMALLVVPVAAAQTLPSGATGGLLPLPGTPGLPPLDLDLQDVGFTFQGRPDHPSHVRVALPDGTSALDYRVDESGRTHLDIAGAKSMRNLTLVAVEGAPTGDEFTLVVEGAPGELHHLRIDRTAIALNALYPEDAPLPAVELLRPPAWPGSPTAPHLLYVQDANPIHVAASALDGRPYLQAQGTHHAALQLPLAEADFDRIVLRVSHEDAESHAIFRLMRETDTTALYRAEYTPSQLLVPEGGAVTLQPFYERHISPLVVERFPEAIEYRYRMDGAGPTLILEAPEDADDFRFEVGWTGSDNGSGFAGVTIDYREAGASQFMRWLTKAQSDKATFSGAWGRTYEFRAMAIDHAGNPSAPVLSTTRVAAKPDLVHDINDPPTARLLSPAAGSVVAGIVTVMWQATDPDGTPVTSKMELSADDGATWRSLYSGPGTRAVWDTGSESDGKGYRLRLTVSDGTQQAGDAANALTVRNIVATDPPRAQNPAPAPAPSPGEPVEPLADADPAASPSAAAEPAKKVPAPFVGLAILGAALLARRRKP